LSSCKSHLDWILSALSNRPLLHKIFQTGLSVQTADDNLFDVHLYTHQELTQLAGFVQSVKLKTKNSKLKTEGGAHDFAKIRQAIGWRYPFGDAPLLPAKRSVTQFTHRNDEFTKLDYSASLSRKPKAILITEQIDGRSIGSAAHLVLSQLDLDKPITTEAITRLINKLKNNGAIAESVASLVNAESISKFFQTELGKITLDKNNSVFREWPFTFALPASQWSQVCEKTQNSKLKTQDFIIIQGIIDLLIQTPKGIVIVDFKTDNVPADKVSQRAELYRKQLDLYAQAASAIIGQKVLSKWLYFLALDSSSLEL
jgi:ATP-dependent helicase/nuclease subunit A